MQSLVILPYSKPSFHVNIFPTLPIKGDSFSSSFGTANFSRSLPPASDRARPLLVMRREGESKRAMAVGKLFKCCSLFLPVPTLPPPLVKATLEIKASQWRRRQPSFKFFIAS